MERKSSLQMTSDFLNSKITEAILEEITDCSIIRTYFLIDFWKLWVNSRYQIRKGHYLVRPLFTVFSHILSNLYFVLWLVMDSGSKSRVRVGFEYCFSGSDRGRVFTFGFLSGSGNFSRVRVGFSGFKI